MTKTVNRYSVGNFNNRFQHDAGEWVLYDDIKHLLQDEPVPHYHQNCATCRCSEPVQNTADV
jgi:hypothetical protein